MLIRLMPCIQIALPPPYDSFLGIIYGTIISLTEGNKLGEECTKAFSSTDTESETIQSISSFDPNEKVGPRLTSPMNYTKGKDDYTYTIYFENKATATAAAQEIAVVDTLDKKALDLSTFSFGVFGFGDTTFTAPSKYQTSFTKDIDLRPKTNLIVRLTAKLDTLSGIALWKFVSLDPLTKQMTEDPLLGFLPPNKKSPQGEGFLSYIVKPKLSLPLNTKIKNSATIVFDNNAPIPTNQWINTIDDTKPVSAIEPLVNPTDTLFTVKWKGNDTGSGVKDYTIFVSEEGGAYTTWIANTKNTSAIFKGQNNKSYSFYSIVRDSVLNIEEKLKIPDVTVKVNLISSINVVNIFPDLLIYPNPATDILTLENIPTNSIIEIYDVQGKLLIIKRPTSTKEDINVANLHNGIYLVKIENAVGSTVRKLAIK